MPLQFFMRSDTFATAAQVSAADFEEIARLGYKTVINNRPDGEGGDSQPLNAELERAAQAAGLAYTYLPVVAGQITMEQVQAFAGTLSQAQQPVLAFCRSGARSAQLAQFAANL
jgi:uncharacterized protein (TIGR01244 family)